MLPLPPVFRSVVFVFVVFLRLETVGVQEEKQEKMKSPSQPSLPSHVWMQMLGSRASNRAYVLASHISPLVQQLFLSSNSVGDPQHDLCHNDDDDDGDDDPTTSTLSTDAPIHPRTAPITDTQRQLISSLLPLLFTNDDDMDDEIDENDDVENDHHSLSGRLRKLRPSSPSPPTIQASIIDQLSKHELFSLLDHLCTAMTEVDDDNGNNSRHNHSNRDRVLNLRPMKQLLNFDGHAPSSNHSNNKNNKNKNSGNSDITQYYTPLLHHRIIPKCTLVTCVNLSGLSHVISDETMERMGQCLPHLNTIVIRHCGNVTDDGCHRMLRHIRERDGIRTLKCMELSHTSITDQTLHELWRCMNDSIIGSGDSDGDGDIGSVMDHDHDHDLETLNCDGINVDYDIASLILSRCKKLNRIPHGHHNDTYSKLRGNIVLRLPNTSMKKGRARVPVTHLDLSGTPITSNILKNVLSVYASPDLISLSLQNAQQIDDSVYNVFRRFSNRMPNLQIVDLDGTGLSQSTKTNIRNMFQQ